MFESVIEVQQDKLMAGRFEVSGARPSKMLWKADRSTGSRIAFQLCFASLVAAVIAVDTRLAPRNKHKLTTDLS